MRRIESPNSIKPARNSYIPEYIPSLAGLKKSKPGNTSHQPADRVSLGPKNPKQWTLMFYLDGNNDLAPMAMKEFRHIRKTGSDENVNLVGFLSLKGAQNARQGLIQKDPAQKTGVFPALAEDIKDTVLQFVPRTIDEEQVFPGSEKITKPEFADPKSLEKFIRTSMKKYPAQYYALVLWDHDSGFTASGLRQDSDDRIDSLKLRKVLQNVNTSQDKVNLLDLNASLMAQTEVAYQLRGNTDYLVSSQELQKSDGVPMAKIMNSLKQGIREKGEITPKELSQLFVFETSHQFGSILFTPTQSSSRVDQIEPLARGADRLAVSLIKTIDRDPKMLDQVRKVIKQTQHFAEGNTLIYPAKDYVDIGDFARRISADKKLTQDPEVNQSARQLLDSVKTVVIAESHTTESADANSLQGSTGLSVYLPDNYGFDRFYNDPEHKSPTHGYEKTDFAQNTHWEELLKKVAKDNQVYEVIRKFVGDHPIIAKIDKIAVQSMMKLPKIYHWANYGGYGGAMYLMGVSKPPKPYALPSLGFGLMGIVGGALQSYKGLTKIKQAVTAPYGLVQEKIKLLGRGGYDVANAAGMVVFSLAMYMGASTVALPAAAVLLTLGVGKLAYQGLQEYRKMKQSNSLNTVQKLAKTENDNLKRFQNMEIA